MPNRCARTAEIELLFDGRLTEERTREVEGHVERCPCCKEELGALTRLRSELAATSGAPNAFVMRRLRREVMERAAGKVVPAPKRTFKPWVFAALGAVLVAFGVVIGLGVLGRGAAPASSGPTAAEVTVTTGPGASYSREEDGAKEIIKLTDGSFDFDVRAHREGRRLVVVIPEGEIEDIGTRFRVVVRDGRTEEVSVQEGEVELRRNGVAPVRLIAGMSYRPLATEAAKASAEPKEPKELGQPPTPAPANVADARPSAPDGRGAPKVTSPIEQGPAPAVPPTAPPKIAAAVRSAAAPKGAAASHPATPRGPAVGPTGEDVAYMNVISLLRAQRKAEAREAARRWLAAYPQGLRRPEMERVAR